MAGKSGAEIKVGIFVFVAVIMLAYMSLQVGERELLRSGVYDLVVYFDSVTGLKEGAPVEIAGIEVGRVSGIELENGRAKLVLELEDRVRLRADVVARIMTRGVLGDKYVALSGGTEAYPELAEGGVIQRSDRSADLEVLMNKIGQIADDIGTVSKSVSSVLGGPDGERGLRDTFENLRDLTVTLNQMVQRNVESIDLIVTNMRDFSGDLRDLSSANKQSIGSIIQNFETASNGLRDTLTTVNSVLAKIDEGQGAAGRLVNDEEMGRNLHEAVASLESVARKIDEGQGTLGRLVNDDTTSRELDKALEGINTYLEKQETFKTSVDFGAEYLADSGDTKTYLNMLIEPSADHFYMVGVVANPNGRTRETETFTTTSVDGGKPTTTHEVEEKTERDEITFNAQIGKRWGDLALRGGLFESTGGAGLDYYVWDDRLKFTFEAYDFDDEDAPHLKAGAKLYFLKNFYAMAGMDDFASEHGGSSFYTGLGLYFTDDDLKYLMSASPVPIK
ncbi:phospholipid/cholesterol/gamma-HCH transport system substrate-binding protein [Desulfobaculum xiamenense]|uniref:Phospholipid/cholesterol/gamma-HCH transport system substrate-binding protein n=1 Tax=Desulfobaculum xiamenense TaxID=995050 RepID=A0A846QIE1_9BACT|nr:MlaD family protein [Desulfobaculum xiamenense]NJB68626.1 phospholipid/cholesterol/gamma-HCH transport system substrate-binding protein [Desulfobaculum xiamenense]